MKSIFFLSILSFSLLMIGCKNDDDNPPQTPLEQLPAATQTGANTFGCLLDGEVFLPGTGFNTLDAVYQLIDGGYFFSVQGNKSNEEGTLIGIALGVLNLELIPNQTYTLLEEQDGQAVGIYTYSIFNYSTNPTHSGELTITSLDQENQTVSGTFWFDVEDEEGVIHQIREGRFDMQYTQ